MMTGYNWNAEDYQQNSNAQFQWAQALIEKLALKGSETVLDLGCGDGKVTAKIAQGLTTGSVMGIDNSEAMISLARQQHPHLMFEHMDARALVFDEQFDVVFSNAVLHWIKDHRSVLAGLYKSLKPGGKILLQMGAKNGVHEYLAALEQVVASAEWQAYFRDFKFPYGFMGTDDYEVLLLENGFSANRIELIALDAVHQNKEKFKGWIRTTWLPYTERVPELKREQFIELIVTKYLEQIPPDTEGQVHVPMVRLEVDAVKA